MAEKPRSSWHIQRQNHSDRAEREEAQRRRDGADGEAAVLQHLQIKQRFAACGRCQRWKRPCSRPSFVSAASVAAATSAVLVVSEAIVSDCDTSDRDASVPFLFCAPPTHACCLN